MSDNEKENVTNDVMENEMSEQAEVTPIQERSKKSAKADKKLAEALGEAIAERDDFKDKYLRTFSDFNNYKKRIANTRADAFKDGQCDAISRMLPVLDNFERALEHIEGEEDSALAQGFAMVYKQLTVAIEQMGINELGAPGDLFDPNYHQAIQMVDPKEGDASGTIAGVVQKGYKMDDRIIRHCMVMVNK